MGRARLNTDSSGPSPYVSRRSAMGGHGFGSYDEGTAIAAWLQSGRDAASREAPTPRAQRAAAALAGVRVGEDLFAEGGGERQDQRRHEAASRARAVAMAARAAPEVVVIEGVAITASRARAGLARGLAAEATAPRLRIGVTAAGSSVTAPDGVAVEVVTLPLNSTAAASASADDAGAGASAAGAAAAGVSAASAAMAGAVGVRRKRRARCDTCTGCKRDDCGECTYCRDMPKFGGAGGQRRACARRACLFLLAAVVDGSSLHAQQPGRMRAAPLAMATLGVGSSLFGGTGVSGMPSGLDFLAQRAGVARPHAGLGIVAPRGVATEVGAGATSVPAVFASGLDLLKSRALPAAPAHAERATERSWAARGGQAVYLARDDTSAAAQRRRAAGLSVFPDGGERREAMATRLHEALDHGYAKSTRAIDEGYWKRWERFCKSIGTSPWRTDMAANSGLDPEGHQEETFLLASAMLHFYETMVPRRHSDPAAKPDSAKKIIESVVRSHRVRGVTMVSLEVVALACKGLCREYIDAHDVHTLVPQRKLSFTDTIIADIFRCPDGATRGGLTVDWSSYHWTAVDACFQTLAEEGSRKDEVAKKSAAVPFRKGRFTFASLVWFINGVELRRAPTRAELLTLKPGDGVLLRHGISKNDPFGSYFAATPSFLAYREGNARCACRALARLELAAAVEGAARGRTPLFGPSVGEEFTHHQLDQALKLLLTQGAGVPEADLEDYSVHSFRIFVACALLAAKAPRWLIKRMLRWRGDESLEVYARLNNTEWADWTSKLVDVAVHSTISSRLSYMDFSEETTAHFNEVARSMLTMGKGAPQRATGA